MLTVGSEAKKCASPSWKQIVKDQTCYGQIHQGFLCEEADNVLQKEPPIPLLSQKRNVYGLVGQILMLVEY